MVQGSGLYRFFAGFRVQGFGLRGLSKSGLLKMCRRIDDS